MLEWKELDVSGMKILKYKRGIMTSNAREEQGEMETANKVHDSIASDMII